MNVRRHGKAQRQGAPVRRAQRGFSLLELMVAKFGPSREEVQNPGPYEKKVTLFDGSYHDVDSNENAFKMAASMAFKDGMRQASPVLLEPMMAVEVETPEDFMGNVMGDLSSRRGMVQGMEDLPTGKAIKAEVPLAEMFGYSTTLRSMSQGRATYTMEFKHYSEAPKNVADAIITARTK